MSPVDDPLGVALAYVSHATSEACDGSWLSAADLLDAAAAVLRGMDRDLRQAALNPEPPESGVCECTEPTPAHDGACSCGRLIAES